MGVNDIMPDDDGGSMFDNPSQVTLQQLIEMFGEGAVKRGVSYMASLEDAEQNWRESANESKKYGEEYVGSFRGDGVEADDEVVESVNEDWKSAMEEGGLGLDE